MPLHPPSLEEGNETSFILHQISIIFFSTVSSSTLNSLSPSKTSSASSSFFPTNPNRLDPSPSSLLDHPSKIPFTVGPLEPPPPPQGLARAPHLLAASQASPPFLLQEPELQPGRRTAGSIPWQADAASASPPPGRRRPKLHLPSTSKRPASPWLPLDPRKAAAPPPSSRRPAALLHPTPTASHHQAPPTSNSLAPFAGPPSQPPYRPPVPPPNHQVSISSRRPLLLPNGG